MKLNYLKMKMAHAFNNQALELEKNDSLKEAIVLFEKAYEYCKTCGYNTQGKDDLMAVVSFHLGNCYWQDLQFKRGLYYCNKSLELYRSFMDITPQKYRLQLAHTLETIALIHMSLRDRKGESECYCQLIPIYHTLELSVDKSFVVKRVEVLNRLAFNHCKSGLFALAEAEYHELIEILSAAQDGIFEHRMRLIGVAYEDLGRLYMERKKYFIAPRYLNISIRFLGSNRKENALDLARVYDCKANCILKANHVGGNMGNALALIDKAIKLDPKNADWYDTRGQILLRMGERDEAIAMWDKVIELEPYHLEVGESGLYKELFEQKQPDTTAAPDDANQQCVTP